MCHDGGNALVLVFPSSGLFAHLKHLEKKTSIKNHREDRTSEHYPPFSGGPWWFLDHVSFPCLLEGCELVVHSVVAQPRWAPQADTHRLRAPSWEFCCQPRQGFGLDQNKLRSALVGGLRNSVGSVPVF